MTDSPSRSTDGGAGSTGGPFELPAGAGLEVAKLPEELLVPSGLRAEGRVRPPSSKSVSHRVLNLALLARRRIVVRRLLVAEDLDRFRDLLAGCGFRLRRRGADLEIEPPPEPGGAATLDCGNAGTLLRFALASLATLPGRWRLDGKPRLAERPIGPLATALEGLGVGLEWHGRPGFVPVTVAGGSLRAGRVRLDAGESSQYLSALLMAGLAAPGPIAVEVDRLTSAPYVELTREAIAAFGGRVERRREEGREAWRIEPGLTPPSEIEVEADYSAAAYPAAAAALSGGRVELAGLRPDSAQGDRRFLELLGEMGAEVEAGADGWRVAAAGELSAVDVDLSTMPDQVPTLAALAPFARGITRIRGAAHLRIKESDRLAAMARELGRLGVPVRERPDGLEIEGAWARRPPPDAPTRVDTWDDHRIAMSLALVGLRRPGVVIRRPAVVAKSYPGFWTDLARLLGSS